MAKSVGAPQKGVSEDPVKGCGPSPAPDPVTGNKQQLQTEAEAKKL